MSKWQHWQLGLVFLIWVGSAVGLGVVNFLMWLEYFEARRNRIKRLGRKLSQKQIDAKWSTTDKPIAWEPLDDILAGKRRPTTRLEGRFARLMVDDPHIYERFSKHVFAILQTGGDSTSTRKVLYEMRFDEDSDGDAMTLSDNFTPYLARLWMERNRRYVGFLVVKKTSKEIDGTEPASGLPKVKRDDEGEMVHVH
jgi:hypothetical protein